MLVPQAADFAVHRCQQFLSVGQLLAECGAIVFCEAQLSFQCGAGRNLGAGFGKCGEGHVRISAFNSRDNVVAALARIAAALK